MVVGIGEENVVGTVDGDTEWEIQPGRSRQPAVSQEALCRSHDCGDHPRSVHLPDPVVGVVRDEEVARGVEVDAEGVIEPGRSRLPAVPEEAYCRPRDSGDDPRGVHLPDLVVVAISDVEFAPGVEGDVSRSIKLGRSRLPAVPGGATCRRPRYRGDDPRGVDLPDPVVEAVGDVEVARGIEGDAGGAIQLGCGRGTAVPAKCCRPVARDRGDDPIGGDLPDPMVELIRDVEVAREVGHGSERLIQLS